MLKAMDQAIAARVRARIEAEGDRFWRPDDFAALPARAVDRALSRLAAENELRHIRRGLYWRGHKSPFGMSRPAPEQTVAAVVGRVAVGPASVSAANALGLSSQVSPVETIAVPVRPPMPFDTIRFVDRTSRHARLTEALTSREVALLEVLQDWGDLVELDAPTAQSKIARLLRGDLRPQSLARGARDEPPQVRERLRYLLEAAGELDAREFVAPARTPEQRREALRALEN